MLAVMLGAVLTPWVPAVGPALLPGPVISGHRKWEPECDRCHHRFNRRAQSGLCVACHTRIGRDQRTGQRLHGRHRDDECRACHTDHQGRAAAIAAFDQASFDHDQASFQLRGRHAAAACTGCHPTARVAGQLAWRRAPSQCHDCHGKDDPHRGQLGADCAACHDDSEWLAIKRFDHALARFPLLGRHGTIACADCHASDPTFREAGRPCNACHQRLDQDRGHQGRFGPGCGDCHTEQRWTEIRFDHDRDTGYRLRGAHRGVACDACHQQDPSSRHSPLLSNESCASCDIRADLDQHHQPGAARRCASCHDHPSCQEIRFAATGPGRAGGRCEHCHATDGSTERTPAAQRDYGCAGCHRQDDRENGHRGGLGDACADCHDERGWNPWVHRPAVIPVANTQ